MKRHPLRLILLILLFIVLYSPSVSVFAFRYIGTPVREGIFWGSYAGPGKTKKTDTIYIVLGRYQESILLQAVGPGRRRNKGH